MARRKRKPNITAFLYDKKGNILSVGKNSYTTTHELQVKYAMRVGMPHKVFLHAEIHAIAQCKDLSRVHRILVTRFGVKGEPQLAKPCTICMAALMDIGVEKIEYTVSE